MFQLSDCFIVSTYSEVHVEPVDDAYDVLPAAATEQRGHIVLVVRPPVVGMNRCHPLRSRGRQNLPSIEMFKFKGTDLSILTYLLSSVNVSMLTTAS